MQLLGLKAELLRKQQEIAAARASNQTFTRPTPKVKLKSLEDKVNKGVEIRERRAAEAAEAPPDLLQKSQIMLEAKTKLYEKLSSQANADSTSNFLVNFSAKEKEQVADSFDDDDDWVDFVDCLGRTKRCLKEDLLEMKNKDNVLRSSMGLQSVEPVTFTIDTKGAVDTGEDEKNAEMMSADMHREMLRQKWEQQEEKLLGARDVHYQDLLFDGKFVFIRDVANILQMRIFVRF